MKKRVQELIDMGCYTQVNSSHVLKPKLFGETYKFMKKRAQYFWRETWFMSLQVICIT